MRSHRAHFRAGFSLVELVVAIALLSLALGMVASTFRGMARLEERLALETEATLSLDNIVDGLRKVERDVAAIRRRAHDEWARSPVALRRDLSVDVRAAGGAAVITILQDGHRALARVEVAP